MAGPTAQARPFLTALRDRWWIVALCTFTAGILGWGATMKNPGPYEATAVFGLQNQYLDRDIFGLSAAIESTEEVLVRQPGRLDTPQAAIETTRLLGLQPATDARRIQRNTNIEIDPRLFLPVARGRASTPQDAQRLVDTFAAVIVQRRLASDRARIRKARRATKGRLDDVIPELRRARRLRTVDEAPLRREVQRLTARIVRLDLLAKYRPPTVSVARFSPTPTRRTRPPAWAVGLIAGLFGAMMGCALLAQREWRDRRPRAAEVLTDLRAAILTDLPRAALLPGARPSGPRRGELQALDAVRRVLEADRGHRVVAVTEAVTIGRASAVARLLAETAQQAGSQVLLASNDPHLSSVPTPGVALERYPVQVGRTVQTWLAERREAYDLVVLDLPSPVGSGSALELSTLADRVLAVWLTDSVDRRQLSRLGLTLARAGVPLAGVVRVGGQPA